MKQSIESVIKIKVPKFKNKYGLLTVVEENSILPFKFKRVYFVHANKNIKRGDHAHKKCYQFFLCLNGKIEVTYTNGKSKKKTILKNNSEGLLVPPKIWSKLLYLEKNTLLSVFCNTYYDKKEYLNNYEDFLKYIK
jgi:dTDP-4-dehydrorhamnose 3,5-epimerase-like enzyme